MIKFALETAVKMNVLTSSFFKLFVSARSCTLLSTADKAKTESLDAFIVN